MKDSFRKYLGIPVSGKFLLSLTLDEDWLVDKLLVPGGRIMVAGAPKVGKSILVMQLMLALSEGAPFLGHNTKKSTVLYTDFEAGRYVVQPRLATMYHGFGGDLSHAFLQIRPRSLEAAISKMLEPAKLEPFPEVWIIDPMAYIGIEDENSAAKVMQRLTILDEFRDEHGVAIVLVHHMSKSSRERGAQQYEGLMKLRGSTAISAWLDTGLMLSKHGGGGGPFYLDVDARVGPPLPVQVLVRSPETLVYSLAHAVSERDQFIQVMGECVVAFRQQSGADPRGPELAEAMGVRLGMSKATMYRRAKRLGVKIGNGEEDE